MIDLDIQRITETAYAEILGVITLNDLPVRLCQLNLLEQGIYLSSYQNYACKTGGRPEDLYDERYLRDGFIVKSDSSGYCLILYDKTRYTPRMKFTIAHELGHIRLGHQKSDELKETEADLFAAQLLMPDAILYTIGMRGHYPDVSMLMKLFGVSKAAAHIKLKQIKGGYVKTDLDKRIYYRFRVLLDKKFPPVKDRWCEAIRNPYETLTSQEFI